MEELLGPVVARLEVDGDSEGERLDAFCAARLPALTTRNAVKKALKRGEIRLDGEVAESSRLLRAGSEIVQHEDSRPQPKPFPTAIDVLYEDDHLAVVYKPAGLRVNGPAWRTLENALGPNLAPSQRVDALRIVRVAHRLDQPTQGLVLCGKTAPALVGLGQLLQARKVEKTYVALCLGRLDGQGEVTTPIDGRAARSRYRATTHSHCLKSPDHALTTVRLMPVTGRRHQLRRHLAELGHPVLGDVAYTPAGTPVLEHKGLFLAAVRLALPHPVSGEPLVVEAPEPPKFASMRDREDRRYRKYFPEEAP